MWNMNVKKPWVLGPALGIVLLVVFGLYSQRRATVPVLQMQAGPLVRTLQFSARVATLSRVDIGSTLTGRVVQVRVREGAQVRRGEVLIQLETEELRAALGQAQAAQQQAQTTLSLSRVSLERGQKLVSQGFYSPAQIDEAQRALDVAQAQLVSAQATVVAAKARLEQATLLAPTDARVLSRLVEPGQIVQPGKALMSLALAGPTQLSAQVDERFLDQLRTGQKAMVVADAFAARRFPAHVLSIAPVVDPQRGAIEVKFALEDNAPDFLREDMTLSVEVETGRRERALVLPLSSLQGTPTGSADNRHATVQVLQDGHARARQVRLGLQTLDAVEVVQGLSEGELVLIQRGIADGQRIGARIVPWQAGMGDGSVVRGEDAGSTLTNAMGN
jgi:HlyD family secretion protein